ncbi:MAG TPA: hypothetical protein PLV73_06585 [Treponemataceae bacterium]|jgi:pilus assembly protein TadC|nr:hypothetical protein [Treponemataceae bacterium]HPA10470.1 hypothetical protein [Treponemataceae bacterium]HQF72274.1 hypothetical protein [Treponemataceae bacterium]HRR02263.1 hypothetical protein [Treponemataceae bacterium]
MLQFYFLSILLNAVTGLVLLFADPSRREETVSRKIPEIAYDETFRLVLGILAGIAGFFKLLTVVRGDVPIVGDLFPAVAGMAAGFMLLHDFYRSRSSVDDDSVPVMVQRLVAGRRYIGIIALVSASAHFLFPTVLFL